MPAAAIAEGPPTGPIQIASAWLGHLEQVMANIGGVLLFALMGIVVADVTARALFNTPFDWALDLISLYVMAAQFYFPLSATFQDNGHIAVDILQPYLGNATRRASQAIIGFLSFGLFLAISIAFYGRAMEDWQSGAAHAGDYAWPSWLSMAIVPIGAGVLSLRCLLHGVGHLCALFGMRHTIPLPPIALSANISEAHVE